MTTAVLAIAFLAVCALLVGTAIFGILWAAVSGLVSLVQDVLARVKREQSHLPRPRSITTFPTATSGDQILPPADPEVSTEAMWQQMQGISKRSRGRRRIREH